MKKKMKLKWKRTGMIALSVGILLTMVDPMRLFAENTAIGEDHTSTGAVKTTFAYQYKAADNSYQSLTNGSTLQQEQLSGGKLSLKGTYSFEIIDEIDENQGTHNRAVKEHDYLYYPLPANAVVDSNQTGQILDDNGEEATHKVIGNWSVADGNRMKLQFTDFVNNMNLFNIKGGFTFAFDMDLKLTPDAGKTEVKLPKSAGLFDSVFIMPTIPPDTAPEKLEKTVSYDPENFQLTWTMQVPNAKQNWEGYQLQDPLPATVSFLSAEWMDAEGNHTPFDASCYDTNTHTVRLKDLTSEMKKIQILTAVNPDVYTSYTTTAIENKASIIKGSDEATRREAAASQAIDASYLSKKGSEINGNQIKWEISVNQKNYLMKNAMVIDTMQNDILFDQDTMITITYQGKQEVLSCKAPSTTFSASLMDDGTEKVLSIKLLQNVLDTSAYTITFVTDVAPGNQTAKYSNKARLVSELWKGNGKFADIATPDISSGGVGINNVSVKKSCTNVDAKAGLMKWKIETASNQTSYGKTEMIDTINQDNTDVTFTKDVKVTDSKTKRSFTVSADELDANQSVKKQLNGASVTVSFIGADYTKNQQMILTFDSDNVLRNMLSIEVDTKIKPEVYLGKASNTGIEYRNTAESRIYAVGKDIASENLVAHNKAVGNKKVTNELNDKAMITKDHASDYPGTINQKSNYPRTYFKLTVNPHKNTLQDVVLQDDLNVIQTTFQKTGNQNATAKADAKWTLIPGSIIIHKNKTAIDASNIIQAAENAYTIKENKLRFDLGDIDAVYEIYFAVELDPTISKGNKLLENGTLYASANISSMTHSLTKDDPILSKSTANALVANNQLLNKQGTYEAGKGQISYRIDLNQHQLQLGSPARIEDFLPDALTLDIPSLTLYKNVLDEKGDIKANLNQMSIVDKKDYTITYASYQGAEHPKATSKLSLTLPDSTGAYVLVYRADVNQGHFQEAITNEAAYAAQIDDQKIQQSSVVEVNDASGGSATRRGSAKVSKVDAQGKPLEGAVFQLMLVQDEQATWLRDIKTAANGEALFTFLNPGQRYLIKEKKAAIGYQTDTKDEWQFSAEAGKTLERAAAFVNVKVKSDALVFQGEKRVSGKEWPENRTFDISLSKAACITNVSDEEMLALTYPLLQKQTVSALSPSYRFDPIRDTYQQSDWYAYYRISEAETAPGYTNLSGTYIVKVSYHYQQDLEQIITKIERVLQVDAKGVQVLDQQLEDGALSLDFTNDYQTKDAAYELTGKVDLKAIAPAETTLQDQQFTFALYETGATVPKQIVKNDADGAFRFDPFVYTQKDAGKTFHYQLKQQSITQAGIQIDDAAYDVAVAVEDLDDGTLKVTVTIKQDGKAVESMTYTNTYQPEDTDLDIKGSASLSGSELTNKQFRFRISLKSEQGLQTVQEGFNNKDGSIDFSALNYTVEDLGKEYIYQIEKIDEQLPGYQSDPSIYLLQIKILDVDGKLVAQQKLTKDGQEVTEITFHDTYVIQDQTHAFQGKVTLEQGIPAKDQFSFALLDEQKTILETVKNDEAGQFKFSELLYTAKDVNKTYVYYVQSVEEKDIDLLYDAVVYRIEVSIKDNKDGTLLIEEKITDPKTKEVLFVHAIKQKQPAEPDKKPEQPKQDASTKDQTTASLFLFIFITSLGVAAAAMYQLRHIAKKNS